MKSLCLLEDDPIISKLLEQRLTREGFKVSVFNEIESIVKSPSSWDFYILDILINGKPDGFELCQQVRLQNQRVPVLLLSALSEPSHRVEGLNLGADDYLTKPFEMDELLVRVKGMLKRHSWYQQHPQNKSFYSWDSNTILFNSYEGKNGSDQFPLSEKECMLLKLLVEKKGEVVTREEILDHVWGYDAFPSTRVVDNFIVRFRKVFESEKRYFQTVRGVGYKFTPEGVSQ